MEYRSIRIGQIGNSKPVDFAVRELRKYLIQMEPKLLVDILQVQKVEPAFRDIIWVGCDALLARNVPAVENPALDDGIAISVHNNNGYITGSNERSVLIAAYRFLRELGCAWVRPGSEGERIPDHLPENIQVTLSEAADYRYRGVCMEGACSGENVMDMIDYLPKVGMNAYYIQFLVPYPFLNCWYTHENNPNLPAKPISREEAAAMTSAFEWELQRRGIAIQRYGHGWTCEPFGLEASYDTSREYPVSEEYRSCLAEIDGRRELKENFPLVNNLCYSRKQARDKMTDAAVQYCQENPQVDIVHFWLADGSNCHCECAECSQKRPADWYIMMLNELDEKLTAQGLDTKVVFLIYVDLLWEPLEEKIKNPDRFILMFAPISRVYGQSYDDFLTYDGELPPYVRNKLEMPKSLAENLQRLRCWQQGFDGDSFDFDYHLMWIHIGDPGYEKNAWNIHQDMKALEKIGLNGMVSCQLTRCFFPSALPFITMANTLWDRNCDFDREAQKYYADAFGKDGKLVRRYLQQISELMLLYEGPNFGDRAKAGGPYCRDYQALYGAVESFQPVITRNLSGPEVFREEWKMLRFHGAYVTQLGKTLELLQSGRKEKAKAAAELLLDLIGRKEPELQKFYDGFHVPYVWKNRLNRLGLELS